VNSASSKTLGEVRINSLTCTEFKVDIRYIDLVILYVYGHKKCSCIEINVISELSILKNPKRGQNKFANMHGIQSTYTLYRLSNIVRIYLRRIRAALRIEGRHDE